MDFVNQTLGQMLLFGGIVSSVLVTWHLLLVRRSWALAAILGLWLLTAGIWMVVLVDEPVPEALIYLRNLALIGGTCSLWWACLQHLGRSPKSWPIAVGLAALTLSLALVHHTHPGPTARAAVFSLHIAAWNIATAWAFLRARREARTPGTLAALLLFGGNALVNLARALFMATHLEAGDFMLPTTFTYSFGLVFLILQATFLWRLGGGTLQVPE